MIKGETFWKVKGVIDAMQELQERDGENAKVHCSVIEKMLNEILTKSDEKENAN